MEKFKITATKFIKGEFEFDKEQFEIPKTLRVDFTKAREKFEYVEINGENTKTDRIEGYTIYSKDGELAQFLEEKGMVSELDELKDFVFEISGDLEKVKMFKEKGSDVKNIKGILFPSVSMNCYDLEEDIIVGFRKFAKELGLNEEEIISYNRYNIDLRKLALTQIKKLGLKDDNMKTMEYCTYSSKDDKGNLKFHSHRRDRTLSMNMALFLGKE